MTVSMHTREVVVAAACGLLLAGLTACAPAAPRAPAAPAEAPPLRVMVKLVHGSEDAAIIGAEAARIAGVPVTYAAATSPVWHALALHCTSAADCDAAVARLRSAGAVYQTVEIEGRKTRASS